MEKTVFDEIIKANYDAIDSIKHSAWELHASVNQTYDKTRPYSYHLSMVADLAIKYGHDVVTHQEDVVPLVFGAYYHDSIEDARCTYNDVTRIAKQYMSPTQAHVAAEIVYALTNEKGRNRAERANATYYAGICATPFAPFVKLCDRVANMSYSHRMNNKSNCSMWEVYVNEWEHFITAISSPNQAPEYSLPQSLVSLVEELKSTEQ